MHMKAIVYTTYGLPAVLQLREVAKPVPKDNQVLVKVYAASANALDFWRFEKASLLGRFLDGVLLKAINTVIGADIAGRVEAVGSAVTQFRPGDEVFGQSKGARGAFAEYACADENEVALKPANLSFEQAAAVSIAAITALQGLRDHGQIQPGQKVLIHGASGGVGTFAVQLAKSFGAEVTAMCSTRNLEAAHQIGTDHVIDYTREDFTRHEQRYDLVVAVNGNRPLRDYLRALNPGGMYVALGGSVPQFLQGALLEPLVSRLARKKVRSFIAKMNQKDLFFLKELLKAGKVVPVIENWYPISETAEAIRYLAKGHARGKVVITVDQCHQSEQSSDQSQTGENA
jgi:NADPH:quinone reductase-like Zn-dependent oxidoreductase